VNAPIRVLLVEDNDVFRESLAFLLRAYPDVDVVGAVADGRSAASACSNVNADVVVIDYRLPDVDGAQAARAVREACPDTSVVFLSASVGQDEQDAAHVAGAPLVGKDEGVDSLVDALRRVSRSAE
jgi:NarL family two-component system response regulator LiaR